MSIGTAAWKVTKWTGIGVAASVAAVGGFAGYVGYKFLHGTWHIAKDYIRQPTLKKTAALAIVPFAIYGLRYPTGAVESTGRALRGTGTYISETARSAKDSLHQAIENYNDERVSNAKAEKTAIEQAKKHVEEELERERANNKNLEKLLNSRNDPIKSPQSPNYINGQAAVPQTGQSGPIAQIGQVIAQEAAQLRTLGLNSQQFDSFAKDYPFLIQINKDKNDLFLFSSNGHSFAPIAKYDCTTGFNRAAKQMPGDRATPEGIMFATAETKPWNDQFTPSKMRLDMPNSLGTGILITGTYDSELLRAIRNNESKSNGGIVLSAEDYQSLHGKIGDGRTIPVVLAKADTRTLVDYTGVIAR